MYVKEGKQETDFCALEESVCNLNDLILSTKTSYYENLEKLNDPILLISKPRQIFLMTFSAEVHTSS